MTDARLLVVLDRLETEFGLDVSEARLLTGDALAAWLDAAEIALFDRVFQEFQALRQSS